MLPETLLAGFLLNSYFLTAHFGSLFRSTTAILYFEAVFIAAQGLRITVIIQMGYELTDTLYSHKNRVSYVLL